MKYTDLPNKHDDVPSWNEILQKKIKRIERMEYLEKELAARDRLDGYVMKGFEEELKKLRDERDD
tara:strand:- start:391 stop:585 length:195 start_codon:yes stop_codon:yes gene_type:complete